MDTVYFLGRLHVLVLHLPLAFLSVAVVLEILMCFQRYASLRTLATVLWIAGAATAIVTVLTGFMHATESAFADSPGVEAHRWSGVALMVAACAVALLRWRPSLGGLLAKVASATAITATTLLVIVTGHLGGSLTHGETYLVEYAPGPLQRLAGVDTTKARPKPTSFATADLYLDVVAPALQQRCSTCHNDRKRGGMLSLATHESLMKGGETGPVIVRGAPDKSDLLRRISLPHDDEDFMPKEGKTPLTEDEVGAIREWIVQGASASAPLSALKLDPASTSLLQRVLGFGGGAVLAQDSNASSSAPADENEGLPTVDAAPAKILSDLESMGFIVRPVSQSSNLLDIDYTDSRPISPAQLDLLAQIAPQVLRLNLRNAGLGDAEAKKLSGMVNLRRLRLEGNPLGDAAVQELAALKEMRYLNLYGTRVSDAGLDALASLEHLRELYLWNSAVTAKGVARLQADHKDLMVSAGLEKHAQ